MKSDSQSSNEVNCSSNDYCFDMDGDNAEKHMEQSIFKQKK